MIAAGRIHYENNFARILALFAQHDAELKAQQAPQQVEAPPQPEGSVIDPNPIYGLSNFARSSNEALQSGWYTYRTVLTSTASGVVGFFGHVEDNIAFGYEQFGVAGIFAGLGNGIGSGMAEGAKQLYEHGWNQIKITARAYIDPSLAPEIAGAQIGNGLMVPIGAIGLIDGARMTFKAPAMIESGIQRGAAVLENGITAVKNLADDFNNNFPGGGSLVTDTGNIMSSGAADAAIMSLPWDASADGLGICLMSADDPNGAASKTALAQVLQDIQASTAKAQSILEEAKSWRTLSAETKTKIVAKALELLQEWHQLYARLDELRTKTGQAVSDEHITQLGAYLDATQEAFAKLGALPADASLNFVPSGFLQQSIIVSTWWGHLCMTTQRFAEAQTVFIKNFSKIERYLATAESSFPAPHAIQAFDTMLVISYNVLEALARRGYSVPPIHIQYFLTLVVRDLNYFLTLKSTLHAELTQPWLHILRLIDEHPLLLHSETIHVFLEAVEKMYMEPDIFRIHRPDDFLSIHPADYFSELANIFEQFAQKHTAVRPIAHRMRELANNALAESLQ